MAAASPVPHATIRTTTKSRIISPDPKVATHSISADACAPIATPITATPVPTAPIRFTSLNSYLLKTPQQYKVTVVNNNQYTARAIPYDLALFYQDDFAINRKLTFSYGLRWETQNEIHDKSDFAPRIYLAYAIGHGKGKPKTVVRAGYGWFYQRFTVPNGSYGVPYIISDHPQ